MDFRPRAGVFTTRTSAARTQIILIIPPTTRAICAENPGKSAQWKSPRSPKVGKEAKERSELFIPPVYHNDRKEIPSEKPYAPARRKQHSAKRYTNRKQIEQRKKMPQKYRPSRIPARQNYHPSRREKDMRYTSRNAGSPEIPDLQKCHPPTLRQKSKETRTHRADAI